MSFIDKIKDALSGDKAKQAGQDAADALKDAAEKLQAEKARDEAEAREAADRDAEKAREAEAQRQAAEQRAAEEARQAEEAEAARRAQEEQATFKPAVSVGRVREVVAHDSDPNTPTGEGLDKELGMLLESALRRALDQNGLPNRNTDDGSLGTLFLESYSRWQGHLGYSGNDADGMPGRDSLAKLAEATGMFDVVD